MAFLDEYYLLSNKTAVSLYEGIRDLPIIDAHNHCDVEALWRNEHFADIWEAEAATDHYVWECLRKRGIPEELITGDRPNEEKWEALAGVFDELLGNPTFEWIHLDLKRMLGIEEIISADSAESIWERSKDILHRPEMRRQELVAAMNVQAMCSTDDPIDRLEYHTKLEDSLIPGVVRPTFRPDRAMNIFKSDWRDYVGLLEERVNSTFKGVADLIAGLQHCHDHFAEKGCVASDHGVDVPHGFRVDIEDADSAFRKAYAGEELTRAEQIAFMSYVLGEVAEMDAAKDWVFQLHLGAVRDVRDSLFRGIGPDTGGDVSSHLTAIVGPLRYFLNRFDDRLNVVLYNMNPAHTPTLAHLTRAFGAKVNLGLAWWLNDSPIGMKRQLEYVGTVDVLMNLAGMVSDSRKILSYGSRHEMFRRVLADVLGTLVEQGQAPRELAERTAAYLCHERPKALFGL